MREKAYKCVICGRPVTRRYAYCARCIYEKYNRVTEKYKGHTLICVKSTGTFRKGAEFQKRQFDAMLKDGSLDPGSIWKDDEHEYRVVGNELYHALIDSLRLPDWDYLETIREGQRVVRYEIQKAKVYNRGKEN